MPYRTYIHRLDNDSLLQIFSHYRLNDGDNWSLRLTWRNLAHVCRKWRYLIYDLWSHLDICLLLTNESPSIATLSHLPPLPLVIDCLDTRTGTKARKDEENISHGLQWHGPVRRVTIRAPSSSLREWLELMNNPFPRLRDLSLSSTTTEETNLSLPGTLQAPDLRHLSLHGIRLPIQLLYSMFTLSTLSLTHIGASSYFSPGRLVAQLQGLAYLEELSIGFAIPIPLPSNERELISSPIPPVTLPNLRWLTFRGVSIYLDSLVAQINTPVLERLSLAILFELAFTLGNLTEFIHRTEGFGRLVARVFFNKDGASINADHYEQRDNGILKLHIKCERLDWQIDSATQVCNALGKVLSSVDELSLDLDSDGMPPGWEETLDDMLWHELLLPFTGVKKLHIGSSLTFELSQALESVAGGLVLDFLPELQELDVQLVIDHAKNAFSAFVETRESENRPVHLVTPPRQHAESDVRPDRRGHWSGPFPADSRDSLELEPLKLELLSTRQFPEWRPESPTLATLARTRPHSPHSSTRATRATPSPSTPSSIHESRYLFHIACQKSLPSLPFDQVSFSEYMTCVGRHSNQAINLISICQTFIQAQQQTFHSYCNLKR